jgi:thiosulfate/3-mercaptopyruvate sulfurtransferase
MSALRRQVLVVAAVGGLLPAAARAQDACGEREPPPGPLVSAEWLKRHRADSGLVLLHVARSRAAFDSAHIPGARLVTSGQFTVTNGDLITELPPVARLDSLFESLGIGDNSRLVIYGEVIPATRFFFTAEYLGLEGRVSIMNGGLDAWRGAGGPVTALPDPEPAPAGFTARPAPAVLADAGYVNAKRASPSVLLLDARTEDEFDGTVLEEGVIRPGHIPGAVRFDWFGLMADGKFLGKGDLRQLFAAAGAAPGKEVITYCRVGSRASVLYFAARVLGYPVRMYDGSMNDWSRQRELPVAGTP